MAGVRLVNVVKKYDSTLVIPQLNLEVEDKEFVVLVGPSGCGKTTTLRMVAGLEEATEGQIFVGNREVTELRPGLRNCSMVFQNYALYPHMTVKENIAYGLKVRKTPAAEVEKLVSDAARILGLTEFLNRRPKHLSGGQRQRVAIGRAIVRNPDVFLFDEPLSNLDAKLRIEMRAEIKNLHHRLNVTMMYVTHDQVEAMTLADRVVVMRDGVIEQMADPITLYEQPANTFVAGFIGAPSMNFLSADLLQEGEALQLQLEDGSRLPVPAKLSARYAAHSGKKVTFGIRPEHVCEASGESNAKAPVKVNVVEPLGPHTLLMGQVGETRFTAQVDAHLKVQPGESCPIHFNMESMHLFDPGSGKVL